MMETPIQPSPYEEKILRRIPLEILAVTALLTIPAALLFGLMTAGFFFAGGAMSAVSFLWLKQALG